MTVRPGMCLLNLNRRLVDDIDVAERRYIFVASEWGEGQWNCYTITFWTCKLPEMQHDIVSGKWLEEQKEVELSEMVKALQDADKSWKYRLLLSGVKQ